VPEPLTLPELRCFLAVAQARHFGRAAEALGISQPAVSQAVARLEQRLGLRLVDREGRTMALTAAGETLHVRTARLVEDLDRAVTDARRAGQGQPPPLVLAVAESLLHPLAAGAVAAVLAASPAAQVTLREIGPEQQLAALRGGSVDLGLLYLPVPADAGLVVETVRTEAVVVALPRGHRLGQRRRLRLGDLHGERAVGVERSQHPALYDAAEASLAGEGVRLDVVQEVSGKQAVLALVAAGVGLAIVPEGARALPIRRVTYRPLLAPGFSLEVALVWRADRRADALHALVAAVHDAARSMRGP